MKGNLEGVTKYLDKMYGRYIQKVEVDPEDDELVVVYGKDNFDDTTCGRLIGDVKALSDVIDLKEWIPFDKLSYDMNAGLIINN